MPYRGTSRLPVADLMPRHPKPTSLPALSYAVIAADDSGVPVERTGTDPAALADEVASWAQQEEDKWPDMGLVYMLITPDELPLARTLEEEGGNDIPDDTDFIAALGKILRGSDRPPTAWPTPDPEAH